MGIKLWSGVITLEVVSLALLPATAQRGAATAALTADDHLQIQQLVVRLSHEMDAGARGGVVSRHFASNVIIRPSAQGATGTHYEAVFAVGQNGQQSTITQTGRYEDTYVKTGGGWQIQTREFHPSITTPEADKAAVPQAPAAGGGGPQSPIVVAHERSGAPAALTALDYLEIQQLVASYGHALDNGLAQSDNGPAYAGLFTTDGVAFRRLRGFDALAAIARAQPRGPRYVRHILTNVTIAPTPEGATGEQYLVVIDPPEGGKPGRLFLGGHYEDIYVKTSQGWRYKSRTLFNANLGAEATSSAPPSEPMPVAVRLSAPSRTGAAAAITSEDYVEIQQLVARYAFALDTADNNGYTYADLFAADGTFNDTKGREALAALPRGPRRGPLNVRNYGGLAIVQATPDGAT